MDREFRKMMRWFGKTHKPYKVVIMVYMYGVALCFRSMTQLTLCFVNNWENLIKVTVCKIVLEGKTLPLNKKYNLLHLSSDTCNMYRPSHLLVTNNFYYNLL